MIEDILATIVILAVSVAWALVLAYGLRNA